MLIVTTESTYSKTSKRNDHDEESDEGSPCIWSAEVIIVLAPVMCQLHLEELPSRMSMIQNNRIEANACSLKKLVDDPLAIRSLSAVKANFVSKIRW